MLDDEGAEPLTAAAIFARRKELRARFYDAPARPEFEVPRPKKDPIGEWAKARRAEDQRRLTRRIERDLAFRTMVTQARESVRLPLHKQILRQICRRYDVKPEALCAPTRHKAIVLQRHHLVYRLAAETELSLPQIGRFVGGRDHTTVLHGIRQHARRNCLPVPRSKEEGPC